MPSMERIASVKARESYAQDWMEAVLFEKLGKTAQAPISPEEFFEDHPDGEALVSWSQKNNVRVFPGMPREGDLATAMLRTLPPTVFHSSLTKLLVGRPDDSAVREAARIVGLPDPKVLVDSFEARLPFNIAKIMKGVRLFVALELSGMGMTNSFAAIDNNSNQVMLLSIGRLNSTNDYAFSYGHEAWHTYSHKTDFWHNHKEAKDLIDMFGFTYQWEDSEVDDAILTRWSRSFSANTIRGYDERMADALGQLVAGTSINNLTIEFGEITRNFMENFIFERVASSANIDLDRIRKIREEVRESQGGWPSCGIVSEELGEQFGWDMIYATYITESGDVIDDHAWNYLPDGSILDATADQFNEGDDIRIVPPDSPLFKRYKVADKVARLSSSLPSYRHDPSVPGEGRNRGGEILVGDKFFDLDEAQQAHILWHEEGHNWESQWSWEEKAEIVRSLGGELTGQGLWVKTPWGEYIGWDEALADLYAINKTHPEELRAKGVDFSKISCKTADLKIVEVWGDAIGQEYHARIQAFIGDEFAGNLSYSYLDGHVYLKDIYVEKEHRRKGVGTALIDHATGGGKYKAEVFGDALSADGQSHWDAVKHKFSKTATYGITYESFDSSTKTGAAEQTWVEAKGESVYLMLDGGAVAWMEFYNDPKARFGKFPFPTITQIEVNHKRRGHGRMLVDWAKDEARKKGFSEIVIFGVDKTDEARNFWRAMGAHPTDETIDIIPVWTMKTGVTEKDSQWRDWSKETPLDMALAHWYGHPTSMNDQDWEALLEWYNQEGVQPYTSLYRGDGGTYELGQVFESRRPLWSWTERRDIAHEFKGTALLICKKPLYGAKLRAQEGEWLLGGTFRVTKIVSRTTYQEVHVEQLSQKTGKTKPILEVEAAVVEASAERVFRRLVFYGHEISDSQRRKFTSIVDSVADKLPRSITSRMGNTDFAVNGRYDQDLIGGDATDLQINLNVPKRMFEEGTELPPEFIAHLKRTAVHEVWHAYSMATKFWETDDGARAASLIESNPDMRQQVYEEWGKGRYSKDIDYLEEHMAEALVYVVTGSGHHGVHHPELESFLKSKIGKTKPILEVEASVVEEDEEGYTRIHRVQASSFPSPQEWLSKANYSARDIDYFSFMYEPSGRTYLYDERDPLVDHLVFAEHMASNALRVRVWMNYPRERQPLLQVYDYNHETAPISEAALHRVVDDLENKGYLTLESRVEWFGEPTSAMEVLSSLSED